MNWTKLFSWLAWAVCLAVALILSIRNLREPDLWWMLRTGEWIVENGKVIDTDHFSFTQAGKPWINVKWMFEVIVYYVQRAFGPESIPVLQTLVNAAIVFLIFRLHQLYRRLASPENRQSAPTVALILATYLAIVGWEYRMIGRPEMTSHLFLMLYLWVYAHFRHTNSRLIFLLIPLQALWTNLHEAFGTGLVMMLAMLAGYWFEKQYVEKENFRHNFKRLLLATLGGIAAIALNPQGPKMILHPFEIFGQVGENKFTTELFSYKTGYFWQQKEAYVLLAVLALALVGWFAAMPKRTGFNRWKTAFNRFGYGLGVLLVLFLYLAFSAHRNIVFFVLVAAPVAAFGFSAIGNYLHKRIPAISKLSGNPAFALLLLFGIGAYAAVGSNVYYQKFNPREHYGLLVAPNKNPVGGAVFLKQTGTISGNIYSDYLTSSYFMWENRPEFKTYVDLRDLDVFPAEFMTQTNQELVYPELWEQANAKYKFSKVILYQSLAPNLHRYLYNHPNWQLAFADPVTSIYLPAKTPKQETDVFSAPTYRQPSGFATGFSKIFWPGYTAEMPPHENPNLIASRYYKTVGNIDFAIQRANLLLKNPETNYEAFVELGSILMHHAGKVPAENKPALLTQAQKYFDLAVANYPEKPGGFAGQGRLALQQGDSFTAREKLEKAIELSDKKDLMLYVDAAQAIGNLIDGGDEKLYDKWFDYMRKAHSLDSENAQLKVVIGQTYCNRGDCKKAAEFLENVTGYPGISPQELQMMQQCKMSCGIK